MGICGSMITSEKNIDNENDIDKIILILNAFMKDKLTKDQIKPFLPNLLYYQILSEKNDLVKSRRFFKWIEMSSILKTFSFYNDITTITNSLKKFQEKDEEKNDIKYDIFFKKGTKEISYTEQGLKQFYSKNKTKFESRMLKSPPSAFRWCAWIIRTCAQSQRTILFYEKIINMKIKKKTHIEILNVIEDTIKEKCEKSNLIKSCLFRLLKSIIILDKEIYYLKEISYVLTYLIVISNFDEVNIFYMIISLLSFGGNNKYGLRGLYLKEKPLGQCCIKIFEKNFNIFFPELKEHFDLIKFDYNSYFLNLIQICYINLFSNILILRIWDYFLIKGISFLINLSFSIIENFYEDLMNLSCVQDVHDFMKKLNPDKYSSYQEIIFDIEEIISNADKKYKITNEEIYNELKLEYPNFKLEFEYELKNISEQNDKLLTDKDSKGSIEEILSTVDRFASIRSISTIKDNDCYYRLDSLIKKGFNLQENNNENIELSISQKNGFGEVNLSFEENSCDDIEVEDENNSYLHEHIKDLKSKQEDSNLNTNCIK